jgi:hypothetical protein
MWYAAVGRETTQAAMSMPTHQLDWTCSWTHMGGGLSAGMQSQPPLYPHIHHGKPWVQLHHSVVLDPPHVSAPFKPMQCTCTTCMQHRASYLSAACHLIGNHPVSPHPPWEAMGPAAPQHDPGPTPCHGTLQAHVVHMHHMHATQG